MQQLKVYICFKFFNMRHLKFSALLILHPRIWKNNMKLFSLLHFKSLLMVLFTSSQKVSWEVVVTYQNTLSTVCNAYRSASAFPGLLYSRLVKKDLMLLSDEQRGAGLCEIPMCLPIQASLLYLGLVFIPAFQPGILQKIKIPFVECMELRPFPCIIQLQCEVYLITVC